ncbi:DNA replication complex subunit Gins51 [Methanobrevibacter curvatus]|uniref:Gins51 C-terminal domain-containing protein n=1 Tax=Methanobrevibacter curvatus TaxID=49547 RepID=A0A166D6Q9_9EURY|nr:hypothetical protein [Methanobrevibacter curvatus]KZX15261.1 hypothetical protein MBCUR_03020 [Methanobrevibacter curvatus]
MNDDYFQILRELQRMERANLGKLSKVGSDFYKNIHSHMEKLSKIAVGNVFAEEHNTLKHVRSISSEICEIRENKIATAAVDNIRKSYHLFRGKKQFDFIDSQPLNLTPEEEKLYFALIDILKNFRDSISLDKFSNNEFFEEIDEEINEEEDFSTEDENKLDFNENQIDEVIDDISKENIENKDNSNLKVDSTSNIDFNPKPNVKIELEDNNNLHKNVNSNVSNEENNSQKFNNSASNSIELDTNSIGSNDTNDDFYHSEILDELSKDEYDEYVNSLSNKNKPLKNRIQNNPILIFKNLPAIVGVDEKVYGPFSPQDIVTLPNLNGDIIVKSKKGRYIAFS